MPTMKWKELAVFAAGVTWGLAGMAAESPRGPVTAQAFSPGKDLYLKYCASCHGRLGLGKGPAASALKTPPPDLTMYTQRHNGKFNPQEVAGYIDGRNHVRAHGNSEMPVWGERFSLEIPEGPFTEEIVRGRVLAIVTYIKTLQAAGNPSS